MSRRQPAPSGPVRRHPVRDHVSGELALLLVGTAMVVRGWAGSESRRQLPALAAGLVLVLAVSAYLYRVSWPLDLPLAERLERTRARSSARPLRPWILLAIVGVVVGGGAVVGIDAVLVVVGLGVAGMSLYLLTYTAALRRRHGPHVWAELDAARELYSSLLAARSGRAHRGPFLP